jgi:hypothetical protein
LVGDWFTFVVQPADMNQNLDGEGVFFRILFYGATVSTTSGPELGDSNIVLNAQSGGFSCCLSIY